MSAKGGDEKKISDSSTQTSRSSIKTKNEECSTKTRSNLLFLCLPLCFAIGSLWIALMENKTDLVDSQSKSSGPHSEFQNPREAIDIYTDYLKENPESPEALLGYAKSLDKLARVGSPNSRNETVIKAYKVIVDLAKENRDKVPDEILKEAGLMCAERMGLKGIHSRPVRVLEQLIEFFPLDTELQKKLANLLNRMKKKKDAQEVFRKVLSIDPTDGYAQLHYGLLLRNEDQNHQEAIKYLVLAMENGVDGTNTGNFYIQLGDSYHHIGQSEKAEEVYEKGVREGLFMSKYQRSLDNIPRLKGQLVWSLEETTYQQFFKVLEDNWEKIREEGAQVLGMDPISGFFLEDEDLTATGGWKQFGLYAKGKNYKTSCKKAPFTCSLIDEFNAEHGHHRGEVKFNAIAPGTHEMPHSGNYNYLLRANLALIAPKGATLRVGNVNLTWTDGKALVTDESFEHEVWHHGDSPVLLLIIDIWHPETTDLERKALMTK